MYLFLQITTYEGIKELLARLQFTKIPLSGDDELNENEVNVYKRLESMFEVIKKKKNIRTPPKEQDALLAFINSYTDTTSYGSEQFQDLFERLAENQKSNPEIIFNLFSRGATKWGFYQQMAFFERVLTPLLDTMISVAGG